MDIGQALFVTCRSNGSIRSVFGLQDKNICKKVEVVPIALEIAKNPLTVSYYILQNRKKILQIKKT